MWSSEYPRRIDADRVALFIGTLIRMELCSYTWNMANSNIVRWDMRR